MVTNFRHALDRKPRKSPLELSKCTKKHELLLKVAVILVFVSVVRVAEFHSVSNEVQETFISQLDW